MLRYSLRTGLIVLTALCIVLGWQISIVRERKSLLSELRSGGVFQVITAQQYHDRWPGGLGPPATMSPPVAAVPMIRTWLGDEAIQEVWHSPWFRAGSKEDLDRIATILPEAKLTESQPEPCHPGCFPEGTPVVTPQGIRLIESIAKGDVVVTITGDGETSTAEVQSVFVTDNVLWRVVTDAGELVTTETQPLCRGAETTIAAGKLAEGDTILQQRDGSLRDAVVLEVIRTDRCEKVYNLILGDRQLFIAGGFVARSKPPAKQSAR